MKRRIRLLEGSAVLALVLLASGGIPRAADDTLPGGTTISVSIDQPSAGTVVSVLPGMPATITVRGTASVGAQAPPATPDDFVTLLTIIDDSASVRDTGFCGGDANGDGASDTVLDCEIASAMSLNDSAAQSQAVNEVGVGVFASNVIGLDLNPDPALPCTLSSNAQQGCFVSPDADANGNGTQDVDEALGSILPTSCSTLGMSCASNADCGAGAHCTDIQGQKFCFCDQKPHVELFTPFVFEQGTDYARAIALMCFVAKKSTNAKVIAVFMSDGKNLLGNDVSTVLPCANPSVTFYTFAIGTNASCTSDPAGLGSLQEIANGTGGTCTHVVDPSMLPQVIDDVLRSRLTALTISVDAGPMATIANVSPALPQNGPASVQYETSVGGLADPGSHGICVFASGRDQDGSGFVRECVNISVAVCGNGTVEAGEQCDDGNRQSGDCCSGTCQNEDLGTSTCGIGGCRRTQPNCIDGRPHMCMPGQPQVEGPPHDPSCRNAVDDDCDGLTDREDRADCPLNHFQCYEVHHGPFPRRAASLDDQFGNSSVDVLVPKRICNPASKDREDPLAPGDPDHLAGYKIRRRDTRFRSERDQVIVNQFGRIMVDLVKPEILLVPSAKGVDEAPPAFMESIDHYTCYRVTHVRSLRDKTVTVDDQFGSEQVRVKRPFRLCAPASKNGEPVRDAVTHLLCYRVKPAGPLPPIPNEVSIDNQFGPDLFQVRGPREICVPSLKNPSTCGDGIFNPGGACGTGLPGVCAVGTEACSEGSIVCNQKVQSSGEACDDLDNDCNGQVDDGLGRTTCGVGACTETVDNCSGGTPQTCTPGTPTPEVCGDGLDNDCDGNGDNGCG